MLGRRLFGGEGGLVFLVVGGLGGGGRTDVFAGGGHIGWGGLGGGGCGVGGVVCDGCGGGLW